MKLNGDYLPIYPILETKPIYIAYGPENNFILLLSNILKYTRHILQQSGVIEIKGEGEKVNIQLSILFAAKRAFLS